MTVTYTSHIASCKGLGCFWKLLFRWRGSVYKLIWHDVVIYSILYYSLSITYRFFLGENGRRIFEKIAIQTEFYTDMIPIAFVLGFYVSIVVQRWWAQFEKFTWIDTLCVYISSYIKGSFPDSKERMMRRTILRYINLGCFMTFSLKSPNVAKRFPSLSNYVDIGLLTLDEKKSLEYLDTLSVHPKYAVPFIWAGRVAVKARRDGKIKDDFALQTIITEIARLRGMCGDSLNYDWISIPLVYTQVVTIAVYSYFLATLMGRQFLDPSRDYEKHNADFVVPVLTYLQLIFYMGWLKVAESLVHPFGDDDDDFDGNWFIDRCHEYGYILVDEIHCTPPIMTQDSYWDQRFASTTQFGISKVSDSSMDIPFYQPSSNQDILLLNEKSAADGYPKEAEKGGETRREAWIQKEFRGEGKKKIKKSKSLITLGNHKEDLESILSQRKKKNTKMKSFEDKCDQIVSMATKAPKPEMFHKY